MKKLNYLIISIFISTALWLNIMATAGALPLLRLVFCLWGISPWLGAVLLVYKINRRRFLRLFAPLCCVMGTLASAALIDVLYIHPDAQGGLVFLAMPFYQWAALALTTPLLLFVTREKNQKPRAD